MRRFCYADGQKRGGRRMAENGRYPAVSEPPVLLEQAHGAAGVATPGTEDPRAAGAGDGVHASPHWTDMGMQMYVNEASPGARNIACDDGLFSVSATRPPSKQRTPSDR